MSAIAVVIAGLVLLATGSADADPVTRVIPLGKLPGVYVRKAGEIDDDFRGKMWTNYTCQGAFGDGVLTQRVDFPLSGTFEPILAGSYAVMLRAHDYGSGVNVLEVELNGIKRELSWGDTHPKSYRWVAKAVFDDVPAGGSIAVTLRKRGQFCALLDALYVTSDVNAALLPDEVSDPLDLPPVPPDFQVQTTQHPRLLFTREDLEHLRQLPYSLGRADAALNATEFTASYWGNTRVLFQLPPKQPDVIPEPEGWKAGHYPYWTGMAGNIVSYMDALTYAALYTGEQKYIDKARDYLLALSKWTTWTDPQEGIPYSNSTRIIATSFVCAYDILFDWLSEAERTEVEDAMLRNGCKVFDEGSKRFGSPRRPAHSTQWFGEPSPMGLMALTMYDRRPEARPYLARCWQLVKMSLDTQMTTPHTEGFSYTATGVRPMVLFGDALARITGDTSIVAHPYLREILPYWVLYFNAPRHAGLPNFADAGYAPYLDTTIKMSQAYIQDPRINQYLSEYYETPAGGLVSANCFTPIGEAQDYADLPLDRAFNMGWVALRSAWRDPSGTLLAFNSSPSAMGHCHADANSFVVNVGGQWLATDPGYGEGNPGAEHDFSKGTEGHNTVTVDGEGQYKRGGGKIVEFSSSPELAYVAGDASAGYKADLLKTFRRHVVYVRPDYFLIFDELESDGTPRTFASLLHTDNQGELSKQDGYVVIEKQKQRLWTQVLLPERATLEFTRLEGSTRYGPYVRIAKPEPFVKGSYLMLLAPQAAAPPAGVFEAENLLPPKATTPGNSIVAVTSDVASYVNFFRINSAQDADFVTLALNVKRAGDYEVRFCFIKNTFCGMVDIELDGTKIGSFDGYAPKIERTQETAYGTHALAAGEHTVTFRVTGKNPASTDRYLGLDYIRLVSDDMVAEEPAKPQAPAHAEAEWDGDRIVVKVQVGHERRDTVVLNPGREQFSFEGDAGDGPVLLVKNGNAYWAPARP